MKTHLIAFLAVSIIGNAYAIFGAGDIVHDPLLNANLVTMNSSQLAQWATAIAKYEDQILHQIENIEKLQKLGDLNSLMAMRMGDWKSVLDKARSIQLRSDNLTNNWGISYDSVVSIENGNPALSYTGNGSYVEMDIHTNEGTPAITVDERDLRRYVVVEKLNDNINATLKETEKVRTNILKEIAKTAEELAESETQAETVKLNAKMDGLRVALANVQAQRDEVMQRLIVQHSLNQSETQKSMEVQAAVDAENAAVSLDKIGRANIGGDTF